MGSECDSADSLTIMLKQKIDIELQEIIFRCFNEKPNSTVICRSFSFKLLNTMPLERLLFHISPSYFQLPNYYFVRLISMQTVISLYMCNMVSNNSHRVDCDCFETAHMYLILVSSF